MFGVCKERVKISHVVQEAAVQEAAVLSLTRQGRICAVQIHCIFLFLPRPHLITVVTHTRRVLHTWTHSLASSLVASISISPQAGMVEANHLHVSGPTSSVISESDDVTGNRC